MVTYRTLGKGSTALCGSFCATRRTPFVYPVSSGMCRHQLFTSAHIFIGLTFGCQFLLCSSHYFIIFFFYRKLLNILCRPEDRVSGSRNILSVSIARSVYWELPLFLTASSQEIFPNRRRAGVQDPVSLAPECSVRFYQFLCFLFLQFLFLASL